MKNAAPSRSLRIAIASSGLAHIKRGVETWAEDLGLALRANGVDATTFQGSPSPGEPAPGTAVVTCWRRFDPRTQRLVARLRPISGWRYGFGNGYDAEQTTFAFHLYPRIRSTCDILHVQDPLLALIFDRLHRASLSRPRVILAHGTEEPTSILQKYSNLQHLAPNYLADWRTLQPPTQQAFAIPNFVSLERFHPAATPAEKLAARTNCDLPPNTLIILSVGALKNTHKRTGYLLEEFAAFHRAYPNSLLVIAGAREAETPDVLALAATLPAGSVRILENLPRTQVVELLRAADIFTLASLHEMMPIAVLEALASGLPIAANDTPTLSWMAGPAARLTNISAPGALAAQFRTLSDPTLRAELSRNACLHAQATFSEPAVLTQILAMYDQVAARP